MGHVVKPRVGSTGQLGRAAAEIMSLSTLGTPRRARWTRRDELVVGRTKWG